MLELEIIKMVSKFMKNDRFFFSHLHKINRCHALMIREEKREKMIRDQKM